MVAQSRKGWTEPGLQTLWHYHTRIAARSGCGIAELFAARETVKWASQAYCAEAAPARSPTQPPDSLDVRGWVGERAGRGIRAN